MNLSNTAALSATNDSLQEAYQMMWLVVVGGGG